jgi:hypothetical protein
MANNEGVDIIIKATDQYTKTINNITASNELFGKSVKNIEKEIATLESYMIKLVANGMSPTSGAIKLLQTNLDQLKGTLTQTQNAAKGAGNAIGGGASSLKDSNKQWSALSLIVQDLPFGFRGIQNNLPALFGTMAAGTGAAYFGFSALVAAITAFDMGMFGATKTTNDFGKALKETNKELKDTLNYTNGQVSNLQGLIDVMLDVNSTESIRNKALAEAKEAITEVDEAQGKKIKTIGDAIVAINLYTEAIQQQQMQEVIGKRIAEITIGQIEKRNNLAIETNKANRGVHPVNFFMGNTELQGLETEIIANETLLRQLEDLRKGNTKALLLNPFSKYNASKPTGNDAKDEKAALEQNQRFNEQVIQNAIDAKKQEVKLFEDDAYKKYEVSKQLAQLERTLGEEKIKNGEYNTRQQLALQEGLNVEYANKILLIDQSMQEHLLNQDAKTTKEKKRLRELEVKEALNFTEQRIKAAQTEADGSIRANRGNYQAQKQALEDVIVKLSVFRMAAIGGAQGMLKLDEAIANNKAKIAGLVDPLETLNQSLQSAFSQMNIDMVTGFAENIGEMLAGGEFDFSKLGNILADGLSSIGKALIAFALTSGAAMELFKDPKTWPIALAAGIAAVAAGAFLKSKINDNKATAFANGGIVSGPTMGLVGEYPGAQSNPEVIAPLDKLKDMIGGGGGGMFVLRGQDLLLSVNRAQKASNLKGQNISLA